MKNQRPERLLLIVSIIERGRGGKLIKLYRTRQVFTHIRCEGSGTATSEILDILGIGSSEKDIVLSLAPASTARSLLAALDDELRGQVPGRGIAFTLSLEAVSNLAAAVIAAQTKTEKEVGPMEQTQKSSLILVTVNQGFTDAVMDTAKKAGARGGTIVRGRWVGGEDFAGLQRLSRQEEKEILAIVVPREKRNGVLEAVNRQHGLQTEAGALICALGIDQLVHLG